MNPFLTVSQINNYISYKFKSDTKLQGLLIKGEITGYVRNFKSGHAYFSLKDESSLIKCVMFSSSVDRLRFTTENGMSVIAYGNVEIYERNGEYQLKTFEMFPSGIGEEAIKLEMLKTELLQLGVFDKPKKEICKYPKEIAVVTSKDAAALGDIITTVQRRYPIVKLIVYPASVQGSNAPIEIANAIKAADDSGADTIIVARGGGSKEDLSAYNTREVAMALYSCKTPVICAVGHEIDVSFADAVADLRAPTPTGAAELATPDITTIISEISLLRQQVYTAVNNRININSLLIEGYMNLLNGNSQKVRVNRLNEAVDNLKSDICGAYSIKLRQSETEVKNYADILNSLNPDNILKKGYAIVYKNDSIIDANTSIYSGDKIIVKMHDRTVYADVTDVERK